MKNIKKHPVLWSFIASLIIVFIINPDTGATLMLVDFFIGMFWILGKAIKAAIQKYSKKVPETPVAPARQSTSITLPPPPDRINGCALSYKYQNIFVYTEDRSIFNLPGVEVGQTVVFYRDHNHYDEGAVAVLLHGCIIGYLHDSRIRNMARGWLKENRPIFAQISYVSPGERNGLKINIAFYK